VQVVGLILAVDRMERTKDSELSAVKAVEQEFGFPVLPIANVREIFAAAQKLTNADGKPVMDEELASRAADYLRTYGA
ncbi:orotate phosphoribosyltransferase, partial [Bifidobacteriaceae bacterium NR015]